MHVAGSAVVWKVVTNWPYPVRPCAPKVLRQIGSKIPAKEKHELAHVVQLSGRDFSFHTGIAMGPGRVVALWKHAPSSVWTWSEWTVDQTQTPLSGRR